MAHLFDFSLVTVGQGQLSLSLSSALSAWMASASNLNSAWMVEECPTQKPCNAHLQTTDWDFSPVPLQVQVPSAPCSVAEAVGSSLSSCLMEREHCMFASTDEQLRACLRGACIDATVSLSAKGLGQLGNCSTSRSCGGQAASLVMHCLEVGCEVAGAKDVTNATLLAGGLSCSQCVDQYFFGSSVGPEVCVERAAFLCSGECLKSQQASDGSGSGAGQGPVIAGGSCSAAQVGPLTQCVALNCPLALTPARIGECLRTQKSCGLFLQQLLGLPDSRCAACLKANPEHCIPLDALAAVDRGAGGASGAVRAAPLRLRDSLWLQLGPVVTVVMTHLVMLPRIT